MELNNIFYAIIYFIKIKSTDKLNGKLNGNKNELKNIHERQTKAKKKITN